MIDGKYALVLETPYGPKRGSLELISGGVRLTGTITALGREHPIRTGSVRDDRFHLSGVLQTGTGGIPYECSGKVSGDALVGTVRTAFGLFPMSARKIP